MSFSVPVTFESSFLSTLSRDSVFRFLSHYPVSFGKCFPGIESFECTAENTYQWKFQPLSYGGYTIHLILETVFRQSPDSIFFESITDRDPSQSRVKGNWTLSEKESKTCASFGIGLEMKLPLPFFLKSMATPMVQKELTKVFDRYLKNVATSLTK